MSGTFAYYHRPFEAAYVRHISPHFCHLKCKFAGLAFHIFASNKNNSAALSLHIFLNLFKKIKLHEATMSPEI